MMMAVGCAMMWAVLNHPCHPVPVFREHVAVIRASGIGHPPRSMRGVRATLMAKRAAEVVAVSNLAKRLGYHNPAKVKGFRYASAKVRADGSVLVVVEKRVRR